VINPGGGWPTKRWSAQRYGNLADKIAAELGLPAVVTTGPGEEALYQAIAASCRASLPRHFTVSFLQLIPLFKRTRLVIGGDTGPFHLACALGTPVVGIFGPTSPARNGSWRSGDEVVAHTLPCSYCYGRTCPTANECMDISVDEVFAAVVRRLANV
jgi:heptosyltransferase I